MDCETDRLRLQAPQLLVRLPYPLHCPRLIVDRQRRSHAPLLVPERPSQVPEAARLDGGRGGGAAYRQPSETCRQEHRMPHPTRGRRSSWFRCGVFLLCRSWGSRCPCQGRRPAQRQRQRRDCGGMMTGPHPPASAELAPCHSPCPHESDKRPQRGRQAAGKAPLSRRVGCRPRAVAFYTGSSSDRHWDR